MTDRAECAELADLLAEVATGAASGTDRARVLRHLNDCDDCRQELDELTRVADEVLLIAPEREPPAGFENAVLERIADLTPATEPAKARPPRSRRLILYAAAASVLVLGGAGGGAEIAWHASSSARELAASYQETLDIAGGSYFSAAHLVGPDGTSAGTVFFYKGTPSWLFVVVQDAPDGSYDVMVTTAGQPEKVATCTVTDGSCSVGVTLDAYPTGGVHLTSPNGVTLRTE